jgi:hypothetical protein
MRKASAVEVTPICSSFSLISRIGEIRICSLWRKFVEMAQTPKDKCAPPAPAGCKAVINRHVAPTAWSIAGQVDRPVRAQQTSLPIMGTPRGYFKRRMDFLPIRRMVMGLTRL